MKLQSAYAWLEHEPGPKMLLEALKLYGTKEMPGNSDNPEILQWARETGLEKTYSADSIPWCGLFMAYVAKQAGKDYPKGALWALNWSTFGIDTPVAMLGDVIVFKRATGGHVAIYVGQDAHAYHVLGGNQSDAVNITRILKERCVAIRRPIYSKGQPPNVRKMSLKADGVISKNEQ